MLPYREAMNARRTLVALCGALLLVCSVTACATGVGSRGALEAPSIGAPEPGTDMSDVGAGSDSGGSAGSGPIGEGGSAADSPGAPATADRSVIQSGDLRLTVDDPRGAAKAVAGIVSDLGGYVESESIDSGQSGPGSVEGAVVYVRVPADRIDDALARLSGLGTVISQHRAASDVTAQQVDLRARVAALDASVARLMKLMQGATRTSDLLEAESALAQRQQELDGLRAQLDALEDQVAQASIAVSLEPHRAIPGGPANFWDGLGAGWDSLAATAAGALVVFGVLLPWLGLAALIAGVILLIVRTARRRTR